MNKALELINQLIKEHEQAGYCTDYKHALCCTIVDPETDFNNAYDVGRYETLCNLYNELTRLQKEASHSNINKIISIEIDAELYVNELGFTTTAWCYDLDGLKESEAIYNYIKEYEPQAIKALEAKEADYIEVYRDI